MSPKGTVNRSSPPSGAVGAYPTRRKLRYRQTLRRATLGAVLWLAIATLVAAEPGAASPTPYLRLRETTAAYHGASEDFKDLKEVRLGWFAPFKADDPVNGDLWWSASFAVEEANRASSRAETAIASEKLPVRLIPCWTDDPWGSGVSQLTRMVYNEQPLALLGSLDSATTHLAEQVVAKANLTLVSPITTDKTTTLAGVSWMFSCAPDDTAVARALVDRLLGPERPAAGAGSSSKSVSTHFLHNASEAGLRLVLLATTDHESRMTAREVMRELSRRGHAPAYRFEFSPGLVGSEAPLKAAIETRPAAVLVIAGASDAARLTTTLRASLGAVPLFGSHTMGSHVFLERAGAAAEGVQFPLLIAPAANDPERTRFTTRFRSERRRDPDYTALLTYDATRLLIEALRRAGPNRARLRDNIAALSPWTGLAGAIEFDGTGRNRRAALTLGTYCGGAIVAAPAGSPLFTDPSREP